MKKLAVFCALCVVSSMFVLLVVPTVSAEPVGWGTPEMIESDCMGDSENPQVAVDSSGNAVAIWQHYDGLDYHIRSSRYVVGVGWTVPVFIQMNESGDSEDQDVAVDPAGNAVAVWSQWDGVDNNIWANRYEVGVGWGMAEKIETDAGAAYEPDVAVDPSGNAIVVWEQYDGIRDNVWANRYVVGTGWGVAELIETNDTGPAGNPQIAVDPSGNAIAVWQKLESSRYDIWSNRYVAGVGWGTPELVETNDTGPAWDPQLGVDAAGNAVVVWHQLFGFPPNDVFNIWANRYVVGTGWGTPELIETDDTQYGWYPQVTVDPSGNATAVWRQVWDIWANRYTVGTGWGTAELIETDPNTASEPQVAADAAGNVIAVWKQSVSGWDYVWANRYVVGIGWGTAEIAGTGDSGDVLIPQVAVDPSGNAMVVWDLWDVAFIDIWSNRYVVGTGWGTPELVEVDTGSANDPQIAVDPSGNATVVWLQDDGALYNVWARRYVEGIGWTDPSVLETNEIGDATEPQVAVDPNGNAIAVWYQNDGIQDSIWSNRYVAGVGWGTAELVETNDTMANFAPQVAVDSAGNAIAVWADMDAPFDIWANRYEVGVGWGTAELIETDSTWPGIEPQVAVDPSGNATAVWRHFNGTVNSIWANRYEVGVGWGTARFIEADDTGHADTPQVAMDASGNAIAVWGQHDGVEYNIWANRYAVGTGWGSAETIEISGGGAYDPQVAMDPMGNAMAVWYQWDGVRDNIWANRYEVGVGWGVAELIETGPGATGTPQVAMDPLGNAVAVWYETAVSHDDIWANRYDVVKGWGTAELIETNDTDDAWYPQIAMDANGNAMAVWSQTNVTGRDIWVNRYTAPDMIPPVADAGPDQVVTAGDLVTFDGSGSTDNVGIVVYYWTFDDGGLRMLIGVSPTYSFYNAGIFDVNLTVMDANGNNDTDTVVITVNPAPDTERPVADAGADQTVTAGTLVTFDGSGSTDNVGIDNYTWTFDDGGMITLYGVAPTYTFNNAGVFVVELTVRDAAGNSDADTVVVTVDPPPDTENPVANAGPDRNIVEGTTIILDGSASTDNIGIVNYTWNFTDGGMEYRYTVMFAYQFSNVGVFTITLEVRDAAGNPDTDTVVITVTPAPSDLERPVADAGPDQIVTEGDFVTFDGSASTDNIGIVNYTWTFDDGGTRTLYGVSPTYQFMNAGTFGVTLVVRDAAGNSDADVVLITVNPPPDTEAPVADAGPDRNILEGTTIILDGSASTDNIGIDNYTWTFDDGGMKYRYTVMWSYQFSNVGVFTITLEVRDAAGNPDTDTVVITVTPAPSDMERPVADAGPDQTVTAGTLVTFDGSASTDNIGIVNYTWTFDDSGTRTMYGVAPTYTFSNAGVFVVELTVRDAAGNSDADVVVITVDPAPDTENPVAEAGPDRNIFAGTTIIIDGSASTDNIGIVNYTWNFTDGGMEYRYTVMFAYQFSNAGTIVVTLTVRDAAGNSGSDTVVITVNPVTGDIERPMADAGPDQSVDTGTLVTFDGSGSTDNIGIDNYTWTFDDGGTRTLYGVSPTYQFMNAGTFVVTLTVRDAAGNSDEDVMVVVTAPPSDTEAPVANAGPDQSIVAESTTVLDASGSSDNVGIVNYTWTFTYNGTSRTLHGQLASFKFDVVGSYTVTLTVRDAAGNSDTDTVTISVTAAPGDGEVEKEVMSPLAIAAIVILIILTAIFALMWLMARRKGAGPSEEMIEEEATSEEVIEEEGT